MQILPMVCILTIAVIVSGTHGASGNQDKIFTWINISRYIFLTFNLVDDEKAADAFLTVFAPDHYLDPVSIIVIHRTECHPIRSVSIRVVKPINHKNYNFSEKKKYCHCSSENVVHFEESLNLGVCTLYTVHCVVI